MKIREMSSKDMAEYIAGLTKEVRRQAYGEGYEQGKFDERMETALKEVTKITNGVGINVGETAQEKRDRIVERAKEDVEFLIGDIVPKVEYVVNKNKRTIVALLKHSTRRFVVSKGIAKCAPSDCFNSHIGRAIALRRALGLEVPGEYLNAPQPSEVRVGDTIRMKYYNPDGDRPDSYYVKIINSFDGDKVRYEGGRFDFRRDVDKNAKIIDDSREGDE